MQCARPDEGCPVPSRMLMKRRPETSGQLDVITCLKKKKGGAGKENAI